MRSSGCPSRAGSDRRARAGRRDPCRRADRRRAVEAAIARTESATRLNAFVTVCGEQALETARGPLPHGPFTGVPIAIKDLTETAGIRTTFSSRAFADYVPETDAAVVRRLKEAGFVDRRQDEHARVRGHRGDRVGAERRVPEPVGPGRTPGGSSGGAAAAVAARRAGSRTAPTAAARSAFPPPAAASSA